jgi:hypothetical protein
MHKGSAYLTGVIMAVLQIILTSLHIISRPYNHTNNFFQICRFKNRKCIIANFPLGFGKKSVQGTRIFRVTPSPPPHFLPFVLLEEGTFGDAEISTIDRVAQIRWHAFDEKTVNKVLTDFPKARIFLHYDLHQTLSG